MADRDNALRKWRALHALAAADSGATPAERDTARLLADKLAAAHGFTAADRAARPAPRPATPDLDPWTVQAPHVLFTVVLGDLGSLMADAFGPGGLYGTTSTTNSAGGWYDPTA